MTKQAGVNQPPNKQTANQASNQAGTNQLTSQPAANQPANQPPAKSKASQPRAKPAKQAKFPKGTRAETVEYLEQEHYREDVEEEGLEAEARGVVFLDEDFGGVLREDGGELVLFR